MSYILDEYGIRIPYAAGKTVSGAYSGRARRQETPGVYQVPQPLRLDSIENLDAAWPRPQLVHSFPDRCTDELTSLITSSFASRINGFVQFLGQINSSESNGHCTNSGFSHDLNEDRCECDSSCALTEPRRCRCTARIDNCKMLGRHEQKRAVN